MPTPASADSSRASCSAAVSRRAHTPAQRLARWAEQGPVAPGSSPRRRGHRRYSRAISRSRLSASRRLRNTPCRPSHAAGSVPAIGTHA
ncbi:MerR family transcriptional regulator [Thauera sp. WH-1]|uniref:MerR family transcriptional regulator n=1 Tax=Thauera sp. WH-1 TaxID=3398230 RepID=UPI0039FC1E3E